MFAPTVTIKKLKLKWTMILCQLGSTTYIAAQFYPCYATFIPAAIIVGFSSAPMVFENSFFAFIYYLNISIHTFFTVVCPINVFNQGKILLRNHKIV